MRSVLLSLWMLFQVRPIFLVGVLLLLWRFLLILRFLRASLVANVAQLK